MTPNNPNLNEKQAEAAYYSGGPLLIAAGAGSGKTKTLTTRVLYLLQQGIKPEHIIAITFTNKAAKEMEERIGGHSQQLPFIGTFHSLGARMLRNECHLLGRNRNFTIYDNDDSLRVIRQILKELDLKKSGVGPAIFEHKISDIKNEVLPEAQIAALLDAYEEKERLAALVFKEYEETLARNNAFDFDDLIEKPVRLFQKYPDVLLKYQRQYQYILVDEYQDINTAQYLFIKHLAREHQNLSVVGDDSQAIYSFRGADFRNFLNFERDWPNAKVVLLEENYRSASNIIEAASAVIGNNKLQKSKRLWTRNQSGTPIKIIEHKGAELEAAHIAEQIILLKKRNLPENLRVAALYRTNAQSRAIEQALLERGIPYRIFGGIRFYDRKEIKDIVAGLRYSVNPRDRVSLGRLEKEFLKKPYLELKEKLPELAPALSPVEIINFILTASNYSDYLVKNYPNAAERIQNVHELIRFAQNFKDLSSFLEQISLAQSADIPKQNGGSERVDREESKNAVHLMTIHLAKGLEFDHVFLVGVSEGLLPHQMSYRTNDEMEEERRLMYVAMTRAKKELQLSFYDIPSRFLYEIPPELVEFSGNRSLDDEERWIELD